MDYTGHVTETVYSLVYGYMGKDLAISVFLAIVN